MDTHLLIHKLDWVKATPEEFAKQPCPRTFIKVRCGADEAETGSRTFSWVTCPACLELKGRRKTGISKKGQKAAP